jgi:hypothetical protein
VAFWIFVGLLSIFLSNRGVRIVSFGFTFIVVALIACFILTFFLAAVVHSGCHQKSLGKFYDRFLLSEESAETTGMSFTQLLDPDIGQHELIMYWYLSQRELGKDTVTPLEGVVLHYKENEECIEIAPKVSADHPLVNDVRLIIRVYDWDLHLDISSVADFMDTPKEVFYGLLKTLKASSGKSLQLEAPNVFDRLSSLYDQVLSFNEHMVPLEDNFGRLDARLKQKFVTIHSLICEEALYGLHNAFLGIALAAVAIILFMCVTKWIKQRLRARTLIWDLNSDINNQASEYI